MHENTELLELSMSQQRILLPPSCVLMTSLPMASLFSVFCDLRGRRVHWVPETSGFCQTAVFTVTHAKSLSLRIVCRRGSRINTDRFPKRAPKAQASRGVRRRTLPGNFLDFHSLKSPFPGFIVIQKEYWPDFNLESVFIIKNIFVMKNVTDFRKTVETGVDPCLMWVFGHFFTCHPILGDPGAYSGGERKSKRAEKYGTKKSKERREELFSPFFSFLRAIFSRPFSLPSPPLSAPGSPRMVPAYINTVGDFQSDWRKCNPIKSAKVNGNRKKHRSVSEVFLAVSAAGQHRKFPPHARKTWRRVALGTSSLINSIPTALLLLTVNKFCVPSVEHLSSKVCLGLGN